MSKRVGGGGKAPKPCPQCTGNGAPKGKIPAGTKPGIGGTKKPVYKTCPTCHGNGTVSSRT